MHYHKLNNAFGDSSDIWSFQEKATAGQNWSTLTAQHSLLRCRVVSGSAKRAAECSVVDLVHIKGTERLQFLEDEGTICLISA